MNKYIWCLSTSEAEKLSLIRLIKYIIDNWLKIDLCLRVISFDNDKAVDTYLKNEKKNTLQVEIIKLWTYLT